MSLTPERCFAAWAPDGAAWSAWAKPVLFTQIRESALPRRPNEPFAGTLPKFDRGVAVVVDLDGRDAVRAGLAFARDGWQPVPLFNATTGMKAVVDVVPTIDALVAGTPDLEAARFGSDAPPVFLLDARRMHGRPRPGAYDNRSVTLPQDFPSAALLRSRGIGAVLVMRDTLERPARDLSHVLLRWQRGGLGLYLQDLRGRREELVVSPPSLFQRAWYRLIALSGLRRSDVGGFGGVVPEASSGGYGGYG